MGALFPAAVYKGGGKFYFFCQFDRKKHAAKASFQSVRALCQFWKADKSVGSLLWLCKIAILKAKLNKLRTFHD